VNLRLGLLQTTTGIDPAANANSLFEGLNAVADDGAKFAFTPEMSGLLDRDRIRVFANTCTEAADPVLAAVRATAAARRIWVHLGSLALKPTEDADRLVNRGFLIDSMGAIRARYDKIHLFDVDLPTGERYRESATYAAGTGAVAADTPWGRIGLSICYDLRFPALYAALSEAGATILSIPSAFTRPTGAAHWHSLMRARAIEAGAFVIAAAQTGCHADGRETWGHSLVIDPWGEVLLDMGQPEGHAVIDIDLGAVSRTRSRIPALVHRRQISICVESGSG
jgi:predicted amidohydrolase